MTNINDHNWNAAVYDKLYIIDRSGYEIDCTFIILMSLTSI